MPTKNRRTDPRFFASYERGMLRSAFVSLFWAVINARKKRPGGFTLQSLAKATGSSKHEVSRWFNGDPNWTLNTVANIAHALDLELIIQARDRSTGVVYTPTGTQVHLPIQTTAIRDVKADVRTSGSRLPGITADDSPRTTAKVA